MTHKTFLSDFNLKQKLTEFQMICLTISSDLQSLGYSRENSHKEILWKQNSWKNQTKQNSGYKCTH